jgi:peptidyl-prolyl cis-trans isomerase A (cyclophilin A)
MIVLGGVAPAPCAPGLPCVLIATEKGNVFAEVDTVRAPITGGNFLRYVDEQFFFGGQFGRRVRMDNQPTDSLRIEVIQASGKRGGQSHPAIELERTSKTGIHHRDGTLSMARGQQPNSATSSFFIVINEQPALDFGDHRNVDGQGFGAFGRVVQGMDVVRAIQQSPVDKQSLTPPIRIDSIVRVGR